MTSSRSPTEDQLKNVLVALRKDNPTLGIPKLHALLRSNRPEWTISEKRTRKILQGEGLVLNTPAQKSTTASDSQPEGLHPTSSLIEGLDIEKWTPKVEVKYFDQTKGKGLVAKNHIAEGEILWKEDPFILAPEWDIYDLQATSRACMYCSTPLNGSLVTSCLGSPTASPCQARFCNRLCQSRANKSHPLLCPSKNPSSGALLAFARRNEWMALHALSQCTARILLAFQQDESSFKDDWNIVHSFAQLGMEERAKGAWLGSGEPDRATWKKAFQLYMQAFSQPTSEGDKKKLSRLMKKPIPKELTDYFFDYDAFLRGLGRVSLNLEAHGGLYVLHSHINHSCSPNISIRHLDQRTALSRVTVISKKNIEPGEELCITYVNPSLSLDDRRSRLLEWGFGVCRCARCLDQEKNPNRASSTSISNDLEKELKAGLGVL